MDLNMPAPVHSSNSPSVVQAEQAVNSSIAKFEAAMETLAAKVEDTSARAQEMVDRTKQTVEEVLQLKDRSVEAVSPLLRDMRANPKPWLMTGALLCLGFLYFKFRQIETRSADQSKTPNTLGERLLN